MKKIKYSIQFNCFENVMSSEIFISKKEFNNQLRFLNSLKESSDNDSEIDSYDKYYFYKSVLEDKKILKTIFRFDNGCSSTYLCEYKCKDGFCFK